MVLFNTIWRTYNEIQLTAKWTYIINKWRIITKEDRGIEQQLYETVRGKNFALNCLSWKFTEMIMITREVIPENLDVVR